MRKFFLIIALTVIPVAPIIYENIPEEPEEIKIPTWEDNWDELLTALIEVESMGNPYALGKNEDRGILQITPILVREVNRLSEVKYTHDDAWDPEKSKEMFYVIARHYCPEQDYEKMARIWNGGPQGYKKQYTMKYWIKVQNEINKEVI